MRLPPLHKMAEKFVTDNATGILTGVGVAGVVGTAVLTAKATIKAVNALRYAETILSEEEIPDAIDKTETFRMVWKYYIPPVIMGATTITAIVGANRMSAQRAAALAAAYGLSESRLSEYKEKVLETIGPKKETDIRDSIAQDRVTNNPPKGEVLILTDGQVLCYDMLTGRYFKSSVEDIKRAENKVNQELIHHDSASLSMFFDEIGLKPTSYTDEVGWNQATDGVIEVKFSSTTSEDNRPAIAIDFNVAPHPSYYHQY